MTTEDLPSVITEPLPKSKGMVTAFATQEVLVMKRGTGIIPCWLGLDGRWYPKFRWPEPPEFAQAHWLYANDVKREFWIYMTRMWPLKAFGYVEMSMEFVERKVEIIHQYLDVVKHECAVTPLIMKLPEAPPCPSP